MHWHTETTVADLDTQSYMIDLSPDDPADAQPDQAVVDAAYAAAQSLADAIGAPDEAIVSIDRHRSSDTTSETVTVVVTVA